MHSISGSFPFRSLVRSSLRTSTSFHLQFMHPPQHPSAEGTLSPFHMFHSMSIHTVLFFRFPVVCFFSLRRVLPIRKDHRFSPPPISCAGNKTLVFIVSVCFRSMHSIPSPFRSGFSYLKTCTPFCFHYILSPQHRTRSGKTPSFRRLHLLSFYPSSYPPFPAVCFVFGGVFTPKYNIRLIDTIV